MGQFTPTFERMMRRVYAGDGVACWLFEGALLKSGYGVTKAGNERREGNNAYVHRVAWEEFYGPIPEGLTVDHLCFTRNCVNPLHLDVCSQGENTLRGHSPQALNARKKTCPKGHVYDMAETFVSARDGRTTTRRCRECRKEYYRAREATPERKQWYRDRRKANGDTHS